MNGVGIDAKAPPRRNGTFSRPPEPFNGYPVELGESFIPFWVPYAAESMVQVLGRD
jgi:hypothetical protein